MVDRSSLHERLNWLWYAYRRNNWVFDPRYLYETRQVRGTEIHSPIFFLGVQGGGLTLVSRILRRHRDVVSVTGSCRYWSGADEMQNVLGPILPPELTGIRHKLPPSATFGSVRGWVYATDELFPAYRLTEKDAVPEVAQKFRHIIRWLITRHALSGSRPRFTDKSQVYTVKVPFLNALLWDCSPRFVLVTRNPYAMCYRAAAGASPALRALPSSYTFRDRLTLAAQHWANSFSTALADRDKVNHFLVLRFEDLLESPERKIRELLAFADLEFEPSLVPGPGQRVPFGTTRMTRWFPMRTNVNDRHLAALDDESVEVIAERCEPIANHLGYPRPVGTANPW